MGKNAIDLTPQPKPEPAPFLPATFRVSNQTLNDLDKDYRKKPHSEIYTSTPADRKRKKLQRTNKKRGRR